MIRSRSVKSRGFTLVELLIVVMIVGILALAAVATLGANTDKARASEAVNNIGVIKQQLEMWHMENPSLVVPADLAAWEAAGGQKKAQFTGQYYDDYKFDAAGAFDANSGRYVGTIEAVPKAGVKKVVITFAANGSASAPVIG